MKTIGLIGAMSGRLGNSVAYQIKGSNGKSTQGMRVYQPNVANPRSYGQTSQRQQVAAIGKWYSILKDIVNHTWQGVPSGALSMNRFRSANRDAAFLGASPYRSAFGVTAIPTELTLSAGSLGSGFNLTPDEGPEDNEHVSAYLAFGTNLTVASLLTMLYRQSISATAPFVVERDTVFTIVMINGQMPQPNEPSAFAVFTRSLLRFAIPARTFTAAELGAALTSAALAAASVEVTAVNGTATISATQVSLTPSYPDGTVAAPIGAAVIRSEKFADGWHYSDTVFRKWDDTNILPALVTKMQKTILDGPATWPSGDQYFTRDESATVFQEA